MMMLSLFFITLAVFRVIANPIANQFGGFTQTEKPKEYPKPYGFEYKMDDGNGTLQHRQEIANENGEVKGNYGYTDPNGIYREVNYIAGENGFQVQIKSNEPGIINQNSANVIYVPNRK